jgi:hypothetical protein
MLPKKDRQEITIKKVKYHYRITECVSVVFYCPSTGEYWLWAEDWKPEWRKHMTREFIQELIETRGHPKNCFF